MNQMEIALVVNHIPSISTNNPMVNYNLASQIYIDSRFKALKKYSRKNGSPNNLKKKLKVSNIYLVRTRDIEKYNKYKKERSWKNLRDLERSS